MKQTIENVDDRVGNGNKLIARVESVTLIQFFMRNKYIDVYIQNSCLKIKKKSTNLFPSIQNNQHN